MTDEVDAVEVVEGVEEVAAVVPAQVAEVGEADVVAANRAARNRSMIQHGRRIGGVPGAALAGAMIALRDIYEGPPRDNGAVVVEAPSEPHDVDRDGVSLTASEVGGPEDVEVPAQPRYEPIIRRRSRASRHVRRRA